MISLLDRVGRGENPNLLTGALGLRQKVLELTRMQKLRNELSDDPKAKLQKLLSAIQLNLDMLVLDLRDGRKSPEEIENITRKIAGLKDLVWDAEYLRLPTQETDTSRILKWTALCEQEGLPVKDVTSILDPNNQSPMYRYFQLMEV